MINGGNVPSQRFQPTRKSKTVMRGANNVVGGFRHNVDQKGQLIQNVYGADLLHVSRHETLSQDHPPNVLNESLQNSPNKMATPA